MSAPRPTKNGVVLVLFACLTGSASGACASTTLTVYLPLAAVHEPRATGAAVAPAAMVPLTEPVKVFTALLPASSSDSVLPWEPAPAAPVPWFVTATLNATAFPAAG